MRQKAAFISSLLFITLMISCQTDLEVDTLVDQKSDFTLRIRTTDPDTGLSSDSLDMIEVHSEKWNKLMKFIKNNQEGWHASYASYVGDLYIHQKDFNLIHTIGEEGVVINFIDQNGKSRQYSKTIESGELEFLRQ